MGRKGFLCLPYPSPAPYFCNLPTVLFTKDVSVKMPATQVNQKWLSFSLTFGNPCIFANVHEEKT